MGARPGAVDLIGEHNLGDDRSGAIFKLAVLLVKDADAGNVRGQQIRRKLDALKAAADRAGERLGQGGLANAGDIFEQDMPFTKERNQQQFDHFLFAHDDAGDIFAHALGELLD